MPVPLPMPAGSGPTRPILETCPIALAPLFRGQGHGQGEALRPFGPLRL